MSMIKTITTTRLSLGRALSVVLLGAVFALAGCNSTSQTYSSSDEEAATSPTVPRGDAQERANLHTQLAALYLQDNNLSVALDEVRIALEIDSSFAPAYSVAALTHMRLGENDKAEENFRKALNLAPGDPEIINNYGWFLCQTDRPQEAMTNFLRAAKNPLYQTPDRAYLNAGICSLKLKDYQAAEDYMQRALGLARNNPTGLLGLATAQYYSGKTEAANKTLKELRRLIELNAEALWLQLRVARRLGDKTGENIAASQLKRDYRESPEYQMYVDGKFD